jgi:integrase
VDRQATRPGSLMTVEEFWQTKFEPQHLWRLKRAGQLHYAGWWRKLAPVVGQRRLCDVTPDDVQTLVAQLHREGYSGQSILHARNVVSAIFRHARYLRLYGEDNPAAGVRVPEVRPERRPSLTWEQARRVLAALRSPYREMAWLSIETSMNAAELCGLRRKWLNPGPGVVAVEGEVMAPYSVAVRENFYAGQYGTLKTGRRHRNEPITQGLAEALAVVMRGGRHQEPGAPVFQARTGRPVDTHNVSNRVFRPLAVKLGFAVTWHGFRRAHSSFVGQLQGVPLEDRVRTMGHADAAMTLHYSVEDLERRRRVPQEIMARLFGPTGERVN